jgi:hypothetical protein
MPSHARGGRHRPNYWVETQILAPDVDRTDAIAVEAKATGLADIHTHSGFVPTSASWAFLGGVRLILENHPHPKLFCFVGDQPANLPCGHLMNWLVGRRPVIHSLPQIPHIADDHRLHPARVEGGDQGGCLFMQDVANLVIDFP